MTDKELIQQAFNALNKMTDLFPDSSGGHSQEAEDNVNAALVVMADLAERLQQPEKTNQCAETCERAKLWGWAILHNDGTEAYVRPRVKEFFGTISETEPFTAEDLHKADREWCGLAPHTMVTLYTSPQSEKPNQCAETCERAYLCAGCGIALTT